MKLHEPNMKLSTIKTRFEKKQNEKRLASIYYRKSDEKEDSDDKKEDFDYLSYKQTPEYSMS